MFLNLLGRQLCPIGKSLLWYSRVAKARVQIGKEMVRITLDVSNYNKDEITVKAHPEYVLIEGKQERETDQGFAVRQFVKKYKLPKGCHIDKMECTLSPEGILTVTSPRRLIDPEQCDMIMVPIDLGAKKAGRLKWAKDVGGYRNPCADYPKVKAIDPSLRRGDVSTKSDKSEKK